MKKIKKIKKISLPKLKRIAWKLWSEIGRKGGVCELCGVKYGDIKQNGKKVILHAHHLIGRENCVLSWDILNCISLCSWCHKFSKNGPHRGGLIFSEWYRQKYPENYKYLLENYTKTVEITEEYLNGVINNLKGVSCQK